MEPSVALISQTQLNTAALLGVSRRVLGRELNRAVDRAGLKPAHPLAQLSILDSITFAGERTPQVSARTSNPSTLDHLHFSFIVAADPEVFVELMTLTSRTLAVTTSETRDFGVISGTLKEWRLVLGAHLSMSTSSEARKILGRCYDIFDTLGLGELWAGFQKRYVDNSFILEHR